MSDEPKVRRTRHGGIRLEVVVPEEETTEDQTGGEQGAPAGSKEPESTSLVDRVRQGVRSVRQRARREQEPPEPEKPDREASKQRGFRVLAYSPSNGDDGARSFPGVARPAPAPQAQREPEPQPELQVEAEPEPETPVEEQAAEQAAQPEASQEPPTTEAEKAALLTRMRTRFSRNTEKSPEDAASQGPASGEPATEEVGPGEEVDAEPETAATVDEADRSGLVTRLRGLFGRAVTTGIEPEQAPAAPPPVPPLAAEPLDLEALLSPPTLDLQAAPEELPSRGDEREEAPTEDQPAETDGGEAEAKGGLFSRFKRKVTSSEEDPEEDPEEPDLEAGTETGEEVEHEEAAAASDLEARLDEELGAEEASEPEEEASGGLFSRFRSKVTSSDEEEKAPEEPEADVEAQVQEVAEEEDKAGLFSRFKRKVTSSEDDGEAPGSPGEDLTVLGAPEGQALAGGSPSPPTASDETPSVDDLVLGPGATKEPQAPRPAEARDEPVEPTPEDPPVAEEGQEREAPEPDEEASGGLFSRLREKVTSSEPEPEVAAQPGPDQADDHAPAQQPVIAEPANHAPEQGRDAVAPERRALPHEELARQVDALLEERREPPPRTMMTSQREA